MCFQLKKPLSFAIEKNILFLSVEKTCVFCITRKQVSKFRETALLDVYISIHQFILSLTNGLERQSVEMVNANGGMKRTCVIMAFEKTVLLSKRTAC